MSKIAKFGCEILENTENIYSLAKFANFVYFCIACGNWYLFGLNHGGSNFRTQ